MIFHMQGGQGDPLPVPCTKNGAVRFFMFNLPPQPYLLGRDPKMHETNHVFCFFRRPPNGVGWIWQTPPGLKSGWGAFGPAPKAARRHPRSEKGPPPRCCAFPGHAWARGKGAKRLWMPWKETWNLKKLRKSEREEHDRSNTTHDCTRAPLLVWQLL